MSSKIVYTIDQDAIPVSNDKRKLNQLNPDGKPVTIRKNPHVIVADLGLDMPVSCWYITVMAIYIIQILLILEQCV
jgi:hypothetical protein